MISIVIPLYNEEQSLPVLYDHLMKALPSFAKKYEIVFIDDGSTDGSLNILRKLEKKNKNVRIFSFRRNQGKSEALTLGFQKSRGDYIVTLDADLQDRPGEIKKLYDKIQKGYDIISGWRKNRKHGLHIRLASRVFNLIVKMLWHVNLHDYNCGLKIYSKEAAKSLHLYGGMHRFIPLLSYEQGFFISEVEVSHDKRQFGKAKYGFSKLWKDLPDLFTVMFLTKYGKRPLHFFGTVGSMLLLVGVIILGYLWIIQIQGYSIGRRPLLFVGFFAVISGLQVFFTGFLADLIINLSQQEKNGYSSDQYLLRYSSD